MKEPRKHHYVPQFYLAGFTKTGEKCGTLWVFDKHKLKQWESSPKDAAAIRDYNAVDVAQDLPRSAAENAIGKIENLCAPVLYSIIESRRLPTGKDFDIFLNFVALMFARVLHVRTTLNNFADELAKKVNWYYFGAPNGKEHLRDVSAKLGRDMTDEEYAGMAEMHQKDAYTVTLDKNTLLGITLDIGEQLVPILAQRQWSLYIVDDAAPDLITSDLPVRLMWAASDPGFLSPGFGTLNTRLSFPLSRRILAVSSFEGQPDIDAMPADLVMDWNGLALAAGSQAYSSEEEFVCTLPDLEPGTASELLRLMSARR